MKKSLIIGVIFAMTAGVVFAAHAEPGADETAFEHASENSIFNRTTDWFATIGKSPEEKEKIKTEREALRAARRAKARMDRETRRLEKTVMKEKQRKVEKMEHRLKEKKESK